MSVQLSADTDQAERAFERFNALLEITRTHLGSIDETLRGMPEAMSEAGFGDNGGTTERSREFQTGSTGSNADDAAESGYRRQEEHARAIGELLESGMKKSGDDFEGSLIRALSLVSQIVRMLNTMGSGGSASRAGSGLFGFVGGLLSLFGSFSGGGYTGDAPSTRPAGIVHGGEVVFENSIAQHNLDGLLALRSSLQSGRSLNRLFDSSMVQQPPGQDFGQLLAEIRSLRTAWQEVKIEPAISIGQVFDTQRFFIDGDVQLQAFKKKKQV